MVRILAVFIVLLLISCGAKVAGGPGGQTTNGFTVSVAAVTNMEIRATMRPVSYRSGDPINNNGNSLINGATVFADDKGVITISNILSGSYMVEIFQGESLAVIDTFSITEDENLDHGSLELKTIGSLSGCVDSGFLRTNDSVRVSIPGLEHIIDIDSNGYFELPALAPWDYKLVIEGFKGSNTVAGETDAAIKSDTETELKKIRPIDSVQYRIVRDFLDSLGLTELSVEEVTESDKDKISELKLTSRNISVLPENFGELKFLKALILDSNSLTQIPADLGLFTELSTLNISANQLTVLPVQIGDCQKLLTLDLSHNKIERITETVSRLTKLKILRLNSNSILALPQTITQISFLSILDCSHNQLTALPPGMPTAYVNLGILDLTYNRIDTTVLSQEEVEWVSTVHGDDTWIGTQTIQ